MTMPHKYRAQRTVYRGRTYDSKAEAWYAMHLESLLRLGLVKWLTHGPTFYLGSPVDVYRPDFIVRFTDESDAVAVDVKGMETPKFRADTKRWALFGPFDLLVVKMIRNKPSVSRRVEGGGRTWELEWKL